MGGVGLFYLSGDSKNSFVLSLNLNINSPKLSSSSRFAGGLNSGLLCLTVPLWLPVVLLRSVHIRQLPFCTQKCTQIQHKVQTKGFVCICMSVSGALMSLKGYITLRKMDVNWKWVTDVIRNVQLFLKLASPGWRQGQKWSFMSKQMKTFKYQNGPHLLPSKAKPAAFQLELERLL